MPQLTPITKQNHSEKSWTRFISYTFASKDNLSPLAGAEIAKAVTALPMAFVKQQDRFFLVAVLSLTTGTNLFVAPDGRWLGKYIPSVFRGYPFQLAKADVISEWPLKIQDGDQEKPVTGLVCPQIHTACELGYGQGLSANLHAAASNTRWWGTDFNPSQAGFAQEPAAVSGSGANLYDEAFADFANRPDLPDFDYIGIHGIWSWISHANRQVLVDFVRRKLKVGGVMYISYNTLPGWAAFAPMRHLMTEHSEIIGAEGLGIVSRIDGAIDFVQKLLETNPLFSRANPLVGDRITKIKDQNRHYLAHEYFNKDWHPMHFADMAESLEPARRKKRSPSPRLCRR